MLALIGTIGTLLSTFMSADTLSHVLGVDHVRLGKVMLVLWIAAVCLSPWVNSIKILGRLHCIVFVGAAVRLGDTGLSQDFVRIPLSTFVPVFGIADILCNYAFSAV